MAAIAAIVPTRNRADLAAAAVRSLIDQDCAIEIYVSDNSEDPEPLRAYCAAEPRATLLRPSRELSMPEHWNWAIGQVLERSAATHVTVHYDRKLSKPAEWGRVERIAARHPGMLVSFAVDHISQFPPPLRIWQAPWTGELFAIETAAAAAEIAGARLASMGHALPILSNCVVPREVLQAIADRFGDYCSSTGPDSAFMSRFLALADRYLHLDRTTGIVYGAHRSNGMGYMRGKGGDFADFRKTFGARDWLPAAPLPGVSLGQNMLYHEYELVRRVTGDRLPPIDRTAAIAEMAEALVWVDDPAARAELAALLRREGWAGEEPGPIVAPQWREYLGQWRARLWMRWSGEKLPMMSGFAYRSDCAALKAALRNPRRREEEALHLAHLRPDEVPS
jgi:glycosyltransferase involved in cell wall biosynthesis